MIHYIASWLIIAIVLYFAYSILTRPNIERKYLVRNIINAVVTANEHFTDTDKVQLIATWLEDVDFDNVEEWQKYALLNKIKEKLNKK